MIHMVTGPILYPYSACTVPYTSSPCSVSFWGFPRAFSFFGATKRILLLGTVTNTLQYQLIHKNAQKSINMTTTDCKVRARCFEALLRTNSPSSTIASQSQLPRGQRRKCLCYSNGFIRVQGENCGVRVATFSKTLFLTFVVAGPGKCGYGPLGFRVKSSSSRSHLFHDLITNPYDRGSWKMWLRCIGFRVKFAEFA